MSFRSFSLQSAVAKNFDKQWYILTIKTMLLRHQDSKRQDKIRREVRREDAVPWVNS